MQSTRSASSKINGYNQTTITLLAAKHPQNETLENNRTLYACRIIDHEEYKDCSCAIHVQV